MMDNKKIITISATVIIIFITIILINNKLSQEQSNQPENTEISASEEISQETLEARSFCEAIRQSRIELCKGLGTIAEINNASVNIIERDCMGMVFKKRIILEQNDSHCSEMYSLGVVNDMTECELRYNKIITPALGASEDEKKYFGILHSRDLSRCEELTEFDSTLGTKYGVTRYNCIQYFDPDYVCP